MNKKIIVVLIALATVFSYAKGKVKEETRKAKVKEETMSIGTRAGFVVNNFTSGESDFDKDVGIGMGFGAGGVLNYPITDIIYFSPEVSLFYRTLFNWSHDDSELSITEVAISIPLMLQIKPIASIPVHLAAGIQIDIPFSSETKETIRESSITDDVEERAGLDFGVALGIGYRVISNLGVDLRAVIGFTSITPAEKYHFEESSYNQYGIGVSYFF